VNARQGVSPWLHLEMPLHNFGGKRGRANASRRPYAEELPPAGFAAVGRETQPAFQGDENPPVDSVPGYSIQAEIAASRAVRVEQEGKRHAPRLEPLFAGMTPPRSQSRRRADEVAKAASA
jgi:hypothetical protein